MIGADCPMCGCEKYTSIDVSSSSEYASLTTLEAGRISPRVS